MMKMGNRNLAEVDSRIRVNDAQFLDGQLGRDLGSIFFVESFALCNDFSVNHRPNGKKATAVFELFIQGLKLKLLAVFIGPAIKLVFMVDLEDLEILNKHMGHDDSFTYPFACFF